jgi:uncharacterized protein (DUF433 family)
MSIPKQLTEIVVSDPEILGGTPCFRGTRVPLATFLDHVQMGYSLDRFLQGYSSVQRDQAQAVLQWLGDQGRQTIGLELAS